MSTYKKDEELKPFSYRPYQKSDSVKQAEALLQQHTSSQPSAYQSRYQGQMDSLMSQIQNRKPFQYDVNGDALYQQYKDRYIHNGQRAMQDTIGQAAALTGGYGSSYAQNVGQQAYNEYMMGLNDVIPELYQLAMDKYDRDTAQMKDRYAMYADLDAQDYSRYQDQRNAYYSQLDRLTENARYEAEQDYSRYAADYDAAYARHRDTIADERYDAERATEAERYAEAQRIDQQRYDDEQRRYEAEWERNQLRYDAERATEAERYAEAQRIDQQRYDDEQRRYEAEWERNQLRYDAEWKREAERYAAEQAEKRAVAAANAPLDKAKFAGIDNDGNYRYYQGGKEVTYAQGINPHTGTRNPDVKNGTFGQSGYQPNNIDGDPLIKAGGGEMKAVINGHEQNVWQLPNGSLWLWDDTVNKYVAYKPYGVTIKGTANTDRFKASVPSKSAFGGGQDYQEYIEDKIDQWLNAGKLTEDEAATLLQQYGFAFAYGG